MALSGTLERWASPATRDTHNVHSEVIFSINFLFGIIFTQIIWLDKRYLDLSPCVIATHIMSSQHDKSRPL